MGQFKSAHFFTASDTLGSGSLVPKPGSPANFFVWGVVMKSDATCRAAAERGAVVEAVLRAPAQTSTVVRELAFRGDGMPPVLEDYAEKVRRHSYHVTDEDVKQLLASGYTEDMVFEITIASALGAADERLQAGLRALAGG